MVQDCYILDSSPNSNLNSSSLLCGSTTLNDDMITLVQFDLSAIPSGSTVLEADFSLYCSNSANNGFDFFAVYGAASSWNEFTMTWNTGLSWYNSPFTDNAVLTTGWKTWGSNGDDGASTAIKTWVQRWLDGTYSNYGFAVMLDIGLDTGADSNAVFRSSEYATTSLRPKLWVKYY